MTEEPILEPALPIIDAHHHLWLETPGSLARRPPDAENPFSFVRRRTPRYLFDELAADAAAGHNVVATVYVECGSMYRRDGASAMKPVGEVEFANRMAAMAESGIAGPARLCAAIVGHADLLLGDRVADVLHAQIAAGGGRFRGIRHVSAHDSRIPLFASGHPALLAERAFRDGVAVLARLGLSFDAWMLEPQLDALIDMAHALPQATIILNHLGSPLGFGAYAGTRAERFSIWRETIRRLAACNNVAIKLGGLGMPICGFPSYRQSIPADSQQLAGEWRPYVETAIEAFGAERCMFESNFPTESGSARYAVLWNAFKRLAAGASADEKEALFSGTAARIYRIATADSTASRFDK